MALVAAFHEVYGWHRVPESRVRLHPDEWSTYDPAEHTAQQVIDYLAAAAPRERERVLTLERSGKQRKTVLAEDTRAEDTARAAAEAAATEQAALAELVARTETPDAVGAGDTPTGDNPGTSTED